MSFYARHIHKTDSDLTLLNVKTPCFPFPPMHMLACTYTLLLDNKSNKREHSPSLSLSPNSFS